MSANDTDILLWSERQAEPPRRAAGELVYDAELDWPNIAEEIEDVGKSQRQAVEAHLTLALLHDLKAEARMHRRLARKKFTPGMRQKLDIADLYADALAGLPEQLDATMPLPVPQVCPVTLEEMLAPEG